MSKLAELIRLWQARDDARDAWAISQGDVELFHKHLHALREFECFVHKHSAAEVGAAESFWAITGAPDDCENAAGYWEGFCDDAPEGELVEIATALEGPRFFVAWIGEGGAFRRLTAPTREELERKIREAGDA